MFKACAGDGFESRRDTALIMTLADTGGRRNEIAQLRYEPDGGPDNDRRSIAAEPRGRPRMWPLHFTRRWGY